MIHKTVLYLCSIFVFSISLITFILNSNSLRSEAIFIYKKVLIKYFCSI